MNVEKSELSLKKLRGGDEQEFKKLIIELYPFVSRVLRKKYSISDVTAEDVFQETLIRTLNHLSEFKNFKHLQNWFLKVAKNLSVSKLRFEKKEYKYLGEMSGNEINEIRETLDFFSKKSAFTKNNHIAHNVKVIRTAYQKLPFAKKDLLIKRYYLGLTEKEIAQELNTSIGTVKSSLSRLRQTLKEEIKSYIKFN